MLPVLQMAAASNGTLESARRRASKEVFPRSRHLWSPGPQPFQASSPGSEADTFKVDLPGVQDVRDSLPRCHGSSGNSSPRHRTRLQRPQRPAQSSTWRPSARTSWRSSSRSATGWTSGSAAATPINAATAPSTPEPARWVSLSPGSCPTRRELASACMSTGSNLIGGQCAARLTDHQDRSASERTTRTCGTARGFVGSATVWLQSGTTRSMTRTGPPGEP